MRPFTPILCVLLAAAASSARADNLDDALFREGSTIVAKLRAKGNKVVGVLPFELKLGQKPPVVNGGPINKNLAEYLENALVFCNDIDRPLSVLRDAQRVALKHVRRADLKAEADRAKLFEAPYVTWDTPPESAKPDVLLTGRLALSPDYKKATLTIRGFQRAKPETVETIHEFTFPADNYLLADSGVGYSLSRKYKTAKRFGRNELDQLIEVDPPPSDKPDPRPPAFPVELSVYYDDAAQESRPDGTPGAETLALAQPAEGQKVRMTLRNLTDQKIGVVLMVGGASTLYERENYRDAEKWVLEPGKVYHVLGYYQEGEEKYKPFQTLTDPQSAALVAAKGEAAGHICVHVFRPGDDDAVRASQAQRSLRMPQALRKRPANQETLVKLLAKSQPANLRGLIAPGDDRVDASVEGDLLGPVVLTDTLVLHLRPRE